MNIAIKFWSVKLEGFKYYFLRILFLLILLICTERTRRGKREGKEINEAKNKERIKEKR